MKRKRSGRPRLPRVATGQSSVSFVLASQLRHLAWACILALFACGSPPIAVEEEQVVLPDWCDPLAYFIQGNWSRTFENRDHHYRTRLVLNQDNHCTFNYTFIADQLGDADHEAKRLYLSRGLLVVTEVKATGPVWTFTIESYRHYVESVDHDGEMVSDQEPIINDTDEAKLWGGALRIWDQVYKKVE